MRGVPPLSSKLISEACPLLTRQTPRRHHTSLTRWRSLSLRPLRTPWQPPHSHLATSRTPRGCPPSRPLCGHLTDVMRPPRGRLASQLVSIPKRSKKPGPRARHSNRSLAGTVRISEQQWMGRVGGASVVAQIQCTCQAIFSLAVDIYGRRLPVVGTSRNLLHVRLGR